MDRSVKAGKPFFIWHNTTRMHIWTHLEPKYEEMITDKGFYGAGMTELDDNVGVILKKLDDLGIANNTIVIFSSDNGAEAFSWPDGGTTVFRGEKNELGRWVSCTVCDPLARDHQTWDGRQRHRSARGLGTYAHGCRG